MLCVFAFVAVFVLVLVLLCFVCFLSACVQRVGGEKGEEEEKWSVFIWQWSVQFKIISLRSENPIFQVSQRCLLNNSSVRLIDDGPFSFFQGRSQTLSLLCLSSPGDRALCPWLKLLNTSELPRSKPLVVVAFPASLSARSFPITLTCPGQYTHRTKIITQDGNLRIIHKTDRKLEYYRHKTVGN